MMPYRENDPPPEDLYEKQRRHLADEKKYLRRATIWTRIALIAAIVSGVAQLVGFVLRHYAR